VYSTSLESVIREHSSQGSERAQYRSGGVDFRMEMLCTLGRLRPVLVVVFLVIGIFASPAAPAGAQGARATARAPEVEALRRRIETLAAQLGDPDPARRGAAAIDLAAITDRRAVRPLLDALKSARAERRLPLGKALRRFKVAAKILPFIALARELDFTNDWPNVAPLADELRTQLQALGTRAAPPLFASVASCERSPDDHKGPESNEWAVNGWIAGTAGGIGPLILPRILREAAAPSRCRRWAAMQALDEFTDDDKAWTWTGAGIGPEVRQACAALVRAARDPASVVSDEATRILDARREDDICEPLDSSTTTTSWPASAKETEQRVRAFEQAVASGDPAIRREAIDRLVTDSSDADDWSEATTITPLIAPLISDPDEAVRLKAIELLHALNARATHHRDERERDPQGSVPALLKAVRDPSAAVRLAAVKALTDVAPGGPSEWHVSRELLSLIEEADGDVFTAIHTALLELNDPGIVPQAALLLTHQDAGIRQTATYVLRNSGSAELAPRLVPLLNDEDVEVRRAAAVTIRELVMRAYDKPIPEVLAALVEPMLGALGEEDLSIRQSAIEVLGRTKDPRALAPLVAMLPLTVTEYACEACQAVGMLGDPAAIPALRTYLAHASPQVRASAASALSGINDDRVVALLKTALRDPDFSVRGTVVRSLAALGRPSAIEVVRLEALAAPDASVRVDAANALRQFPGPETTATLARVLKDREVEVRQAAAWLLRDIAGPDAVPMLIEALTDEDARVRANLAETLGKLGDPRAVDALVRVLPHTLPEAASALGQIGGERAVDALLDLVRVHPMDYQSMPAVIGALAQIGSPRAVPTFVHVLRSQDYRTVQLAQDALVKLKDGRTVPLLRSRLREIVRPGAPATSTSNEESAIRATLNSLCDLVYTETRCEARTK
jgi:HEAT repeat protein